jgi:HlyD family secretion protein
MTKRTKYLIGLTTLACIAIAAGLAIAKPWTKVVDVKIDTVATHDLVASVQAAGQVQPHTKVDISSDITGRITRLAVKEGDIVKKGQFLLEIDPAQYQAAVERNVAAVASTRAQEAQARATYQQSKRNYDRILELKKRNPDLVSDDQVEQAHTAADVNFAGVNNASHAVAQAAAALRDAQSSLGKTTIIAPIAGRVTRLNVEEGETAIMGTLNKDAATMLTISDMSDLETKVKVDETEIAHIAVGDSAMIDIDAFPDSTFRGIVTEISSSSLKNQLSTGPTDQAVDYEVTVKLLNAPRDTRPDFSTQAKIITATRRNVLAVPSIALTIREHAPLTGDDSVLALGKPATRQVGVRDVEGVFVIGTDNKVTFRPVKVGIAGDKYFEVLSGIRKGERIVAGPYQALRELKDGTPVRKAKVDTKTASKGRP